MSSYAWARSDAKHPPVAVLLPGRGYTVQAPLLYWCARMLDELGWHVQAVTWDFDASTRADHRPVIEDAVAEAFAAAPDASARLIVAKSLGTLALPWARRNGIAGVWLTPVLSELAVRDALLSATSNDLAIGGDADELWMPELLRGTAAAVISVPEASHSLTVPGGWERSQVVQSAVLGEVAQHVKRIMQVRAFMQPSPQDVEVE